VPDKEPPFPFKHTAWHAPDIRRVEAGELPTDQVYGDLLGKAWSKFTARYAGLWLGQEPQAH
jgi:hypothetical protein